MGEWRFVGDLLGAAPTKAVALITPLPLVAAALLVKAMVTTTAKCNVRGCGTLSEAGTKI